jgi:hypothetical protein
MRLRFHTWHLVLAVLASALVLGLFRAARRSHDAQLLSAIVTLAWLTTGAVIGAEAGAAARINLERSWPCEQHPSRFSDIGKGWLARVVGLVVTVALWSLRCIPLRCSSAASPQELGEALP